MPATKVVSNKRKGVDEPSPSPFSEEGEDKLPAQIVTSAFRARAQEPCPPANHSSGGARATSIEGVVLRNQKFTYINRKTGQSQTKFNLNVAVTKLTTTGTNHMITCGIDGMSFGLPTHSAEASPDEVAQDKKSYSAAPVVLEFDDTNPLACYMGNVTFGMELKTGAESCLPGMKVLVSGISFRKECDKLKVHANAKKAMPLCEHIPIGGTAQAIIEVSRSPAIQRGAALLHSMTMKGFFGVSYPDKQRQHQVDVCKALWQQVLDGISCKCDTIATSLSNNSAVEQTVTALHAYATRLRSMSAEEVAGGAPLFNIDFDHTKLNTPYQAALVQYGVEADNTIPFNCNNIDIEETVSQVPNCFVDAKVMNVWFDGVNIYVDFRLFFMFDKAAALLEVNGLAENSIVQTTYSGASVRFSKRFLGPELLGVHSDWKIEMVCKEVLPVANMAIYACVFARDGEGITVGTHFASTTGIDLRDGVTKVGVQVSGVWLDKWMLSGRGVHIFNPIEGMAYVDAHLNAGQVPTLSKSGIQAISEAAFDLDSLKTPAGMSKRYFVIYDGTKTDSNTRTAAVN
jgi:hypothetical protein